MATKCIHCRKTIAKRDGDTGFWSDSKTFSNYCDMAPATGTWSHALGRPEGRPRKGYYWHEPAGGFPPPKKAPKGAVYKLGDKVKLDRAQFGETRLAVVTYVWGDPGAPDYYYVNFNGEPEGATRQQGYYAEPHQILGPSDEEWPEPKYKVGQRLEFEDHPDNDPWHGGGHYATVIFDDTPGSWVYVNVYAEGQPDEPTATTVKLSRRLLYSDELSPLPQVVQVYNPDLLSKYRHPIYQRCAHCMAEFRYRNNVVWAGDNLYHHDEKKDTPTCWDAYMLAKDPTYFRSGWHDGAVMHPERYLPECLPGSTYEVIEKDGEFQLQAVHEDV